MKRSWQPSLLLLLLLFIAFHCYYKDIETTKKQEQLQRRHLQPRNLTIIGLRPSFMDPSDLENKNYGDYAGDLFFWLGDIMANVGNTCSHRSNNSDYENRTRCPMCEITCEDNVYSKVTIELTRGDDSINAHVSNNTSIQNGYARCNPTENSSTTNYTYNCVSGDAIKVGEADVAKRYSKPYCQEDSCIWKYKTSQLLGGKWWSIPKDGNCNRQQREIATNNIAAEVVHHNSACINNLCTWRYVETIKVVDASCVNARVQQTVWRRTNKSCLEECGDDDFQNDEANNNITNNEKLKCKTKCFFGAIFGRNNYTNGGHSAMSREQLLAPFFKAFDSDDPNDGGCPSRILSPSSTSTMMTSNDEAITSSNFFRE